MMVKGGRAMEKGKMKHIMLIVLSVVLLGIGILGIADINFFTSNKGLGVIEILLGVFGLIVAAR
jgi:hypothetical protein